MRAVLAAVIAAFGTAFLVPGTAIAGSGLSTYTVVDVPSVRIAGQPMTVRAKVGVSGDLDARPSGSVHFTRELELSGAREELGIAPVDADGYARITFTPASPGNYYVYADFTGGPGYQDSSGRQYVAIARFQTVVTAYPTVLEVSRTNPLKITLTMSSRLTDPQGNPLVGVPVEYTILNKRPPTAWDPGEGVSVCNAPTDASGYSTCRGQGAVGAVLSVLAGGAWANCWGFGDASFGAAKAPVIVLGGP